MNVDRQKHGFALVELLVVLAILGVLIALLLPALNRARDKALSASCASHLRQNAVSLHLYLADHDGRFFPHYSWPNASCTSWTPWWKVIRPWVGQGDNYGAHRLRYSKNNLLHCPAYRARPHVRPNSLVQMPREQMPRDLRSIDMWSYRSYDINGWLVNNRMRAAIPCGSAGDWYNLGVDQVQLAQIVHPASTVLIGEVWRRHGLTDWDEPYYNPSHGGNAHLASVDGSFRRIQDTGRNGPPCLWCNINGSRMAERDIQFWACYLSPKFTP
jgi:prepilin-type N-terminal cleavage/methylation domain-containing protein